MDEYLYHSVDARHILNIGEQSISNKIQAVLELIKNAYDADASNCNIIFEGTENNDGIHIQTISIEDDGIGMTKNDLTKKLMTVGTDCKVEESFSPKLQRRVSGEKGMGHYSMQRLGYKIKITSTPEPYEDRIFSKEDHVTFNLELDWTKYISGEKFEKISNRLYIQDKKSFGTLIKISELRDSWTLNGKNNDLEVLARTIGSLILPDEFNRDQSDKFIMHIYVRGVNVTVPKIKNIFLNNAPYRIKAKLDNNLIKYGFSQPNRKDANLMLLNLELPAPKAKCGNTSFDIYWFPGNVSEWATGINKPVDLKNKLKQNYGIKIYNDKIRVMPYGELDNDWLGIGSRKAGPDVGGYVRNHHLIGFIQLSRNNNPDIIETTTRQALRENLAFQSLKKHFIWPMIQELEYRVQKIKEEEEKFAGITYPSNIAKSEIMHLEILINNSSELGAEKKQKMKSNLKNISKYIELENKISIEKNEKIIATLEMYRNLSTAGLQVIAMYHEIIDPLSWVKGSLESLLNPELNLTKELQKKQLKECLTIMIASVDWSTYMKQFSRSLSGNEFSKKQRHQINIENTINEIRNRMSGILNAVCITMDEPICTDTIPDLNINRASFDSIFLNLIGNSVRSLNKVKRDKHIQIHISKNDSHIVIEFKDNGYGIDPANIDKIFQPFFTTYNSNTDTGTGMGLTIIKEIIEYEYKGKITVKESTYEEEHPNNGMVIFLIELPIKVVSI